MLYCAVLCCTVLYCAVLCCTVLYCAVLCCTVLYSIIYTCCGHNLVVADGKTQAVILFMLIPTQILKSGSVIWISSL